MKQRLIQAERDRILLNADDLERWISDIEAIMVENPGMSADEAAKLSKIQIRTCYKQ